DLLEDGLEPTAFGVRELAGDAGGVPVRHVDKEPAGQRDLRGQPGALLPDGVLGDLHQHHVPGLERLLDPAGLAAEARGLPVDLTGVEDAVASPPDVDERGLHAGQDVLDATEVDVADHGACRLGGDEVFDEDLVLEHPDLGHQAVAFRARLLAHHHNAVHGLPAGQELGLGEDGLATTPGLAAVPAPLPLGLEPGRPGDALHLVRGRAGALSPASGPPLRVPLVDLGLRRVVIAAPGVVGTGAGAPTAATTAAATTRRTGGGLGGAGAVPAAGRIAAVVAEVRRVPAPLAGVRVVVGQGLVLTGVTVLPVAVLSPATPAAAAATPAAPVAALAGVRRVFAVPVVRRGA